MLFETNAPAIETIVSNISLFTGLATLAFGAVRIIPLTELKLEILEDTSREGKARVSKKRKAHITRSGHAIVPDGQSASVGIFSPGGGLQTCITVKDTTTRNPETSWATITGATKIHLATLSPREKEVCLPGGDLFVKYIPQRNNHQLRH